MYKGEIIHFIGGITEYIGELDQTEHPKGTGWYRIKNPCYFVQQKSPDGKSITLGVSRIWGVDKLYRKYVDLYCPPDSLIEIRTLDKNGGLYKSYMNQLERPSLDKIIPPTGADLQAVRGH